MTREQAANLLEMYKKFPANKIFSIRPHNYPLFYLLECYAKGWKIQLNTQRFKEDLNFLDFERVANEQKEDHSLYVFVARNPKLKNTTIGYVQEDLFARYIGKCNPLKTSNTSWTFIPFDVVSTYAQEFNGTIGKHTKLYQIEIDLDTTNIVGKHDPKLPWHFLQQTIEWKPWTGRIDWNETDH